MIPDKLSKSCTFLIFHPVCLFYIPRPIRAIKFFKKIQSKISIQILSKFSVFPNRFINYSRRKNKKIALDLDFFLTLAIIKADHTIIYIACIKVRWLLNNSIHVRSLFFLYTVDAVQSIIHIIITASYSPCFEHHQLPLY